MKAYVLVETNAGKTKVVKKALGKLKPGKCRIHSLDAVTGPFDYIAVLEGPTLDDIGQLVTDGIGSIEGVTRTTTCLAVSIG
jgi:DNA-binding Lrp family transcriptional regulator